MEVKGKEAYSRLDKAVSGTFADSQYSIDDIIAEGELVAWRQTFRGTFKGSFSGFPPNDKIITAPGIVFVRIKDRKIVETWAIRDMLSMLQQMGVIKPIW